VSIITSVPKLPSSLKAINEGITETYTQTERQNGDFISLLSFLEGDFALICREPS
jgi:hypothetical protein